MDESIATARLTAEQALARTLPRRWSHVRAVGRKAERIAHVLDPADRPVLVAAAWLHDIGYAPGLVQSGFHPLDGARWLHGRGFDRRVTVLVANHSHALIEAAERGLAAELAADFPAERSLAADALAYCDLTTGPDGRSLDVVDRLSEIRSRYGPDTVVARFVAHAEADLISTVRRVERTLDRGGSGPAAAGQPADS